MAVGTSSSSRAVGTSSSVIRTLCGAFAYAALLPAAHVVDEVVLCLTDLCELAVRLAFDLYSACAV